MIRNLIIAILLVPVAGLAGLYVAYGDAAPCRALAVEQARRSVLPSAMAEPWMRMETSQMSSRQCVGTLFRSWRERLEDETE